jgi:acyloxyacyl hydrolase
MGVAILGDSAAAHFHIPPQYLNARSFNLSGIIQMAANEADWPQCSWATGFRAPAECPALANMEGLEVASIYSRLRERNLCMHRDFQNIGVNGARTGSMAPPNGVVNSFSRNQTHDAPMLVFYSLIGNDVCDGHPGSSDWTTVQEFQENVLKGLDFLDTQLPSGSHVVFLGLADGRVLYDTTHTFTHPLGVTYPEVYEFLSCSNANREWVVRVCGCGRVGGWVGGRVGG